MPLTRTLYWPVVEPLAPFRVEERPLRREIGRRHRQIVIGREIEEIRHADAEADVAAAGEGRREQAALAGHRRIGRGKIGDIGDRHAGDLEPRVLVVDDVGLLVLDDLRGADLPQRRPLRMGLARLAGGVDAAVEHRHRRRPSARRAAR